MTQPKVCDGDHKTLFKAAVVRMVPVRAYDKPRLSHCVSMSYANGIADFRSIALGRDVIRLPNNPPQVSSFVHAP